MTCDVLIPFQENLSCLMDSIESIHHTHSDVRIHVYDTKGYLAELKLFREFAQTYSVQLFETNAPVCFDSWLKQHLAVTESDELVLIPEDTLVPESWLERFCEAAQGEKRWVTPLTSSKSPYSIPLLPGHNVHTMDELIQRFSRKLFPLCGKHTGSVLYINLADLNRRQFSSLCGELPEQPLLFILERMNYKGVLADHLYISHSSAGIKQNILLAVDRKQKPVPLQSLIHTSNTAWQILFPSKEPAVKWALKEWARKMKKALLQRKTSEMSSLLTRDLLDCFYHKRDSISPLLQKQMTHRNRMSVVYIVSRLAISGGVFSILQLVNQLTLLGVDARIYYLDESHEFQSWNRYSTPVHFKNERDLVSNFPPVDVVVATHWSTVRFARSLMDAGVAKTAAYFIQDYEKWFYPEEDVKTRDAVAASYSFIPHRIVKSDWLKNLLSADGIESTKISFGLDRGIYHPRPVAKQRRPVLLAMVRPNTPRRGFNNVIETFERVWSMVPEVTFILFGYDYLSGYSIPFPFTNAGVISNLHELAQLYSQADLFFEGSDFQGFGRLTLEAMACKTGCVLTNVGGVNEYAVHQKNCLLVPPQSPQKAAKAIVSLLQDPSWREQLANEALITASRYDHKKEAAATRNFFCSIL
ncbi:MAG: hypothetical protein CSA81_12540 [Acidobacteria bacterium]|nr:MAG: hypothetical protein CSA81_12540 [Acidobacteriota bacterium]